MFKSHIRLEFIFYILIVFVIDWLISIIDASTRIAIVFGREKKSVRAQGVSLFGVLINLFFRSRKKNEKNTHTQNNVINKILNTQYAIKKN